MSTSAQLELERQELIKKAHALIASIANRPGSLKLLKIVVPMLQSYAAYRANRSRVKNQEMLKEEL